MKKILLGLVFISLAVPALAKDQRHKLEIAYEYSDYGYREPHMQYPIHNVATKQGVSVVYTRQSLK